MICQSIVDAKGLVLVSAKLTNQGKRRILEITLHRPGGRVSLDDCEAVSRELDSKLDDLQEKGELLLGEGSYNLSVQSPGIDRKLKEPSDYEVFSGEQVLVTLKQVSSDSPLSATGGTVRGRLGSLSANGEKIALTDLRTVSPSSKSKKKAKHKKVEEKPLPEEIELLLADISVIRLDPDFDFEAEPAIELGEEEGEGKEEADENLELDKTR